MAEFHFLRPYWFIALLPLLLGLWLLWRRRYHSRSWQSVCDPRLLPFLLIGTAGKRSRWPIVLAGLLGTLMIIALAGPTWQKLEQPVFREQSSLVVVLDLSRSMDAADIKPTRLTRARYKLIDILKRRKEGQTALIVYAGNAYTVSPLTDDSQTMLAMVKTLTTDLMPVQGSALDSAVQLAVKLLKQAGAGQGHILVITDGLQKTQRKTILAALNKAPYRLSVLGVGTAQGAPVSDTDGSLLKDHKGAIVIPKLERAVLQQLASAGGGRYQTLSAGDSDLINLLDNVSSHGLNAEREETTFIADSWSEEGPWLLLIVLPFAALAFRRGYLFLLLVICLPGLPEPAYAFEWRELWQRPDQVAAQQLQARAESTKPPPAEVFSDPEWKAAAQYRAGQYQQAVESLQDVDSADAWYNKGNALAKLGNYPAAIKAYDEALKQQADHEDAKYNREQVEKMLQQKPSDQSNQDKDQKQQSDKQKDADQQPQNSDQANSDQGKSGQENQDQEKQPSDNQSADNQSGDKQEQAEEKQAEQEQQKESQDKAEDQSKQDEAKQNQASQAQLSAEKEKQQATEQWLRRIPDDPGGLLRRKFQYDYQRQQAEGQTRKNQDEQQAW